MPGWLLKLLKNGNSGIAAVLVKAVVVLHNIKIPDHKVWELYSVCLEKFSCFIFKFYCVAEFTFLAPHMHPVIFQSCIYAAQ